MSQPREPIEIISEQVDSVQVVQAWCGMEAERPVPRRVELLRRKNKSLIYRLVGVGENQSDVIAKACIAESAVVERAIYSDVLPQLPISQLRYYGFSEEAEDNYAWLFLEDAQGVELDPSDKAHRDLSTRWLAQLHSSAAELPSRPPVPDRGPAYYLEHMREARAGIEASYGNPELGAAERRVLDRILALFDVVQLRWSEIETLCEQIPQTLTHGDFAERNVQIRNGADATPTVVAFDWEVSGWGLPVVDLPHADVELYWSLIRDSWSGLDYETLCRALQVGRLLRGGLAASNWSVPSLATPWPLKAIENLRVYDQRMNFAIDAMGWAA